MSDLLLFPVSTPADSAQREAALDIRESVLVQAPAGSGKTDLLTRRFLRLLAAVNEPEEILAITFTRAATAEMRARILADLEAAGGRRTPRPEEYERIELARAALAHAERRGWNLLEQPQRLVLETIDSLCLRIAHGRPLLAHLGGRLQPTEQAGPLHALAAHRTLEQLGGGDPALDAALAHLLDMRDSRLEDCEHLIAKMLAVRDQWLHAYPLSGSMTEDDWDNARIQFEAPFRREISRVLDEACRLLTAEPVLTDRLLELARYAAGNGNREAALLAELKSISAAMPVAHWQCVCSLLLTKDGGWRKRVQVTEGFPAGAARSEAKRNKDAMMELINRFGQTTGLLEALCAIRDLPPPSYSEPQWFTLRHVLTVLRRAIGELRVVFAERNAVDFTEIALAAHAVLREAPDRAAAIGAGIRHLLIDEFQDTSRSQHALVSDLLAAWDPDPNEHRTVFLVGDPMQSIYMFRQAEVELFSHVRDHGIGPAENRIRCKPVQLSVNFRSHQGLTDPLNDAFGRIDERPGPPGSASVRAARATASEPAPTLPCYVIHPQVVTAESSRPAPADLRAASQQEAREVLAILEEHRDRIEAARAAGAEYRVAVLVRARQHLGELVPLLRRNKIPFRAVEIESLAQRQEIHDLLGLTHALLQPMDRIAWLAVLRAPWCGLTLADLHRLTGSDDRAAKNLSVPELIERHRELLSPDGQQRLDRTMEILHRSLALRWRPSESPSFASWIERTWHTLGGPACLTVAEYENAQVFFSLLDSVASDGLALSTPEFTAQLDRLFAQPDPAVSDRCGVQLMTIHKAKGLGFDVVLVPGLDRKSSSDRAPLICSLERRNPWNLEEDEFLVAPIGARGEETDPLYKWVSTQRKIRFDEERKRLFYVACTRARRELHLFGTAVATGSGIKAQHRDSLLATAWPALEREFAAAAQQQASAPVIDFPVAGELEELAAVAEEQPLLRPRRLRAGVEPVASAENIPWAGSVALGNPEAPEFRRPHGSRHARLVGSAVHTLLERLGAKLASTSSDELRSHAAGLLRASALTGEALAAAASAVTDLVMACAADPVCQWILGPHAEEQSEASWSTWSADSRLRTLRADRVFRAGAEPLAEGSGYLWIIDYKTSPAAPGDREGFLAEQRAAYAPQLQGYARALRAMQTARTPIRLGLYYPAIARLDWWESEDPA